MMFSIVTGVNRFWRVPLDAVRWASERRTGYAVKTRPKKDPPDAPRWCVCEGWRDWLHENIPGWDNTEQYIRQIDNYVSRYSPCSCAKMQQWGLCHYGRPDYCLDSRKDEDGKFVSPSPTRFANSAIPINKIVREIADSMDESGYLISKCDFILHGSSARLSVSPVEPWRFRWCIKRTAENRGLETWIAHQKRWWADVHPLFRKAAMGGARISGLVVGWFACDIFHLFWKTHFFGVRKTGIVFSFLPSCR